MTNVVMLRLSSLALCVLASINIQDVKHQTASVDIEVTGSSPPLSALYSCARNLDGKVFRAEAANECLESILNSKYFLEGHVETKDQGARVAVRFDLKAPSLRISEIDYGVTDDWRRDLLSIADKNPDFLRKGDSYDPGRASSTLSVLEIFKESKGKLGVVTQNVHLDYKEKTAQLRYSFVLAGDWPSRRLPPPYGEPCDPHLRNFNETNIDDFVPINLIDKLAKTPSSFCFSDAVLREDQERLSLTGLFQDIQLVSSGQDDFRDVSVKARGKSLVASIELRAFGLISAKDLAKAKLPRYTDSSYRRSSILDIRRHLERLYSSPGRHVVTFEDDEVIDGNHLSVIISILAVPEDKLFVNGVQFADETRIWPTVSDAKND